MTGDMSYSPVYSDEEGAEDYAAQAEEQLQSEARSSPTHVQLGEFAYSIDPAKFDNSHEQDDALSTAKESVRALNAYALDDSPSKNRHLKPAGKIKKIRPSKAIGKRRRQAPTIIFGPREAPISKISYSSMTSDVRPETPFSNHETNAAHISALSTVRELGADGANSGVGAEKLGRRSKRLRNKEANAHQSRPLHPDGKLLPRHEAPQEPTSSTEATELVKSTDHRSFDAAETGQDGAADLFFATPVLLVKNMVETAEKCSSAQLEDSQIKPVLDSIDECEQFLYEFQIRGEQEVGKFAITFRSQLDGISGIIDDLQVSKTIAEQKKSVAMSVYMGAIPRLIKILDHAAKCFLHEPAKEDCIRAVLTVNQLIEHIALKAKGWAPGQPRGEEKVKEIKSKVLPENKSMIRLLECQLDDLRKEAQEFDLQAQKQVNHQEAQVGGRELRASKPLDRETRLREEREEQVRAERSLAEHGRRTIAELERRRLHKADSNQFLSQRSARDASTPSSQLNDRSSGQETGDASNDTSDHAEMWSDQQMLALLDGLQQHLGTDRYAVILQAHGEFGQALHGMSIEQIQNKAREIKKGLEAYVQKFPNETLPEWAFSV